MSDLTNVPDLPPADPNDPSDATDSDFTIPSNPGSEPPSSAPPSTNDPPASTAAPDPDLLDEATLAEQIQRRISLDPAFRRSIISLVSTGTMTGAAAASTTPGPRGRITDAGRAVAGFNPGATSTAPPTTPTVPPTRPPFINPGRGTVRGTGNPGRGGGLPSRSAFDRSTQAFDEAAQDLADSLRAARARFATTAPTSDSLRPVDPDQSTISLGSVSTAFRPGAAAARRNVILPTVSEFGPVPDASETADEPFVPPTYVSVDPTRAARPLHSASPHDMCTFTRAMRVKLQGKDLNSFRSSATKELPQKFELPDLTSNTGNQVKDVLTTTFTFSQQVSQLKRRLQEFGMIDVFDIIPVQVYAYSDEVVIDTTQPTKLLFDCYLTTSSAVVLQSNQANYQFGDEVTLQNLSWTESLIINSCSDALAEKVSSRLTLIPDYQRGGPAAFMLLVDLIITANEKSTRQIIYKLYTLNLSYFGEDVEKAVAILLSNIRRLEASNLVPPDINETLLRIMRTSSVYAFRNHFQVLESVDSPKIKSYDLLLTEAATRYRLLRNTNAWVTSGTQRSAFSAQTDDADADTVISPNDIVPEDPAAYQQRSYDMKGRLIDRTPPAAGQPHSKPVNDDRKTVHWCDKCQQWGNHLTSGHETFEASMKAYQKRRKAKRDKNDGKGSPSADAKDENQKDEPAVVMGANAAFSKGNFQWHQNGSLPPPYPTSVLSSTALLPAALPTLSTQGADEVYYVILDTGCSFALTPDERDFIEPPTPVPNSNIQTASGSVPIKGRGLVRWATTSRTGRAVDLIVPCHWVPDCKQRLLSPQDYLRYHNLGCNDDTFGGNDGYMWMKATSDDYIQCGYDHLSRLPFIAVKAHPKQTNVAASTLFQDTNINLTKAQQALLFDHARLGHLNMTHLQDIYSTNDLLDTRLKPSHTQAKSCDIPLCLACQLGKAKRQPTRAKVSVQRKQKVLSEEILQPGQRISVDQYESSVLGKITVSASNATTNRSDLAIGGSIYFDHASGLIQVHHQTSLSAVETLRTKRMFEQEARRCGVQVQSYHTDNGVFRSQLIDQDAKRQGQPITFSGVGAHHQNGSAERAIQTVVWRARAMLIHVAIHWPSAFDNKHWTYALSHSAWLYNHTPSRGTNSLSPMELFCSSKHPTLNLERTKVWGCPAYVLDPRLQDGKKIPKWSVRARQGQFLGHSEIHSSLIGLVRNLRTERVSPQYHVVYDQKFQTVTGSELPDNDDIVWSELLTTSRERYVDEDTVPELHSEWEAEKQDESVDDEPEWTLPTLPLYPDAEDTNQDDQATEPFQSSESPILMDTNDSEYEEQADADQEDLDTVRRSTRTRLPAQHYPPDEWTTMHRVASVTGSQDIPVSQPSPSIDAYAAYIAIQRDWETDPVTQEVHYVHPGAYAIESTAEDTPRLQDIYRLPDDQVEAWTKAMNNELEELFAKDTFTVVDRSSVPKQVNVVPSTWVFRRKRKPDGSISKLKARLCVRGDLQEFPPEEELYAPVVEWSTVRILFTLSVMYDLPTAQIDFKNAFVQSTLPEPIYVHLPPGRHKNADQLQNKVFKVKKSLYGDCRAPRLWYFHLREAMVKLGFRVCTMDPCLFLRHDCIFVSYVDDGIFLSKKIETINEVISALETAKLDLTREGDLAGYLGVQIEKLPNGELSLTQPHLIQRVIEALNLKDANPTRTPADAPLGQELDSPPATRSFNYRSLVGMLLYLGNNTRPDCSLAIHQCARHCINPRVAHEQAIKRIGRYLKGTSDKGIIIKPTDKATLECFVDADFAGLWKYEDVHSPLCARSRTGFVIMLGMSLLLWVTKLQTEIALSTMESEYIALSTAMKSFIPIRRLLIEIVTTLSLPGIDVSSISTVFEDNRATQILASTNPPRLTPRSKHIAVKYHWFREHVGKEIVLKAVSTQDQKADMFTKPLGRAMFEQARKDLLGW